MPSALGELYYQADSSSYGTSSSKYDSYSSRASALGRNRFDDEDDYPAPSLSSKYRITDDDDDASPCRSSSKYKSSSKYASSSYGDDDNTNEYTGLGSSLRRRAAVRRDSSSRYRTIGEDVGSLGGDAYDHIGTHKTSEYKDPFGGYPWREDTDVPASPKTSHRVYDGPKHTLSSRIAKDPRFDFNRGGRSALEHGKALNHRSKYGDFDGTSSYGTDEPSRSYKRRGAEQYERGEFTSSYGRFRNM